MVFGFSVSEQKRKGNGMSEWAVNDISEGF